MDAVAAGKVHLSTLNFEEKSLIRAEQHELLRGKNNTTSCRSPTREFDTKSIKNELKEKRQLEFLKRRSLSPEMCGSKSTERRTQRRSSPRIFKLRRYTSESENIEQSTANGCAALTLQRSLSESPTSSKWVNYSLQLYLLDLRLRGKGLNIPRYMCCFYAVYQEALWREQVLKKKLALLQESTTNLMNSSDKIWTVSFIHNFTRVPHNKSCYNLQKFPKDAVKKLLLQMEGQKLVYEDKAVIALQKATQEKTEAVTKAETLQTETQRWKRLYEELRLSSEQLTEQHNQSNDQLLQLHDQLEVHVHEGCTKRGGRWGISSKKGLSLEHVCLPCSCPRSERQS
uniref:Uncharacterized protein n=1 Tax=Periophthalmus magnuspinnatus TaxID=409849 RepID=A0A3B4A4D5_9GOBI